LGEEGGESPISRASSSVKKEGPKGHISTPKPRQNEGHPTAGEGRVKTRGEGSEFFIAHPRPEVTGVSRSLTEGKRKTNATSTFRGPCSKIRGKRSQKSRSCRSISEDSGAGKWLQHDKRELIRGLACVKLFWEGPSRSALNLKRPFEGAVHFKRILINSLHIGGNTGDKGEQQRQRNKRHVVKTLLR